MLNIFIYMKCLEQVGLDRQNIGDGLEVEYIFREFVKGYERLMFIN